VVDVSLGRTRLAWLGAGTTTSSPTATKAELAKLAYLRGLDAHTLDVSMLPAPSKTSPQESDLFDGWGAAVDGGRRTKVRRRGTTDRCLWRSRTVINRASEGLPQLLGGDWGQSGGAGLPNATVPSTRYPRPQLAREAR
jgi:hypothetical protein